MTRGRKETKYHLVYGEHAVLSVLNNASRHIFNILITKERYETLAANFKRQYKDIIEIIDNNYLTKLTRDGDKHQGFALKCGELIEKRSFSRHLTELEKKGSGCCLILDRVQDPHNIGAIIRSACCFDVDMIVVCHHGAPEIGNTIIRTSTGLSEVIPIYTFNNILTAMNELKESGFWIVGMDSNENEFSLSLKSAVSKYKRIGFVLGSEGEGMRSLIRQNCDHLVKIPMIDSVDSLNVSNASAIVAYEYYNAKHTES